MTTRRIRRMEIEKRKAPKLPALIAVGTDGRIRLMTETHGVWSVAPDRAVAELRALRDFRVFSLSEISNVLRWLGPENFIVTLLGRAIVKLEVIDGPSIIGTRKLFEGSSIENVLSSTLVVDEWCRSHGVALGSLGWTSEQFWRLTLPNDLIFSTPIDRKGYFGARKACPQPGTFTDCYYVDIRAAYPSAMISEPFPLRLTLAEKKHVDYPVGMALATVNVPEHLEEWSPLAESRSYGNVWRTGEWRGWFPLRELRAAADRGAEFKLEAVFRGEDYIPGLFSKWWQTMEPGRDFPGDAGRWVKAISNALWGTFGLDRPVKVVRFPDGDTQRPELIRTRKPPPPGAAHLGAEIGARVRERIFRELVPSNPIYVDTDGGIIRAGAPIPAPSGPAVGEWSVRERMRVVEIRGNQAYAFRTWERPADEKIVLAGIPRASRRDFERYLPDVRADTGATFKHRIGKLEPFVFDEQGKPVPLQPNSKITPERLPPGWTMIDPALAGLRPEQRTLIEERSS